MISGDGVCYYYSIKDCYYYLNANDYNEQIIIKYLYDANF